MQETSDETDDIDDIIDNPSSITGNGDKQEH